MKPVIYTMTGYVLGALVFSVIACGNASHTSNEVSMSDMTASLRDKKGDDFDSLFITHMIEHHQAAVDMAKLSEQNAKHEEIKQLSREIITAQEKEIQQMRSWQQQWGYSGDHKGQH
jgi:uncharacterized protein (DUF305 family)